MKTDITQMLDKYLPGYDGPVGQITGSGSNRTYLRLHNEEWGDFIAVYGACLQENKAFVEMARHFSAKGLPVPKIIGELSEDGHFYLQEDLGTRSLFDNISGGRMRGGDYTEEEKEMLHRTIALLPEIQFKGIEGFNPVWCYPKAEFDRQGIMFDLNYFKYCFLKAVVDDIDEVCLEEEFSRMAERLLEADGTPRVFLYRDFQARNVMWRHTDESPCFIDFQGGRIGPLYYDIASFLWQAAARYPQSLRESLIETYLTHARPYLGEAGVPTDFYHRLRLFVLFRLMQVLGAYGFRGYFERKSHFLTSIPPAIENLHALLAEDSEVWRDFPYLHQLMSQVCAMPRFAPAVKHTSLVARVYSFSYKKGIPDDVTGNGGGYVFDCRGIHNPGRYAPYKQLTGRDEPVIRFLEEDGGILKFLESVYQLADAHVQNYKERGFCDLMFSFGCTGGQHRSVYCAEHLAEYLHRKHGITVELCHREQGYFKELRESES